MLTRISILSVFSLAFLLLTVQTTGAQETITMQGVAIDSKGIPLPDGKRTVTFTLYDSPDSENPLWSEQQSVAIKDGRFSATLGSVNPLDLPLEGPHWLGMRVGEGKELSPRLHLTPGADAVAGKSVADIDDRAGEKAATNPANTLDQAYDEGGAGAGRTITADAGAVNIEGAGGLTVNGNLGVGITNPIGRLHIFQASGNINLRVQSDGVDSKVGLRFRNDARNWRLFVDGTNNDVFGIRDVTAAQDRLIIDTSGNVGIGTATPGAKLNIVGDLKIVDGTQGAGKVLTSDASGLASWQTPAGGGSTTSIADADNDTKVQTEETADEDKIRFDTGGVQRMMIDEVGNVGIGTTSPDAKLVIQGPDDGTNGPILKLQSNSTGQAESGRIRFTEAGFVGGYIHYDGNTDLLNLGFHSILNSDPADDEDAITISRLTGGNVGIGQTSPDALLNIQDTSRNPISDTGDPTDYHLFIQGSASFDNSAGIALGNETNDVGAAIIYQDKGNNAKGDLTFWTKSSNVDGDPLAEVVRIKNQGNVGIGLTGPSAKLHIEQAANADAFRVDDFSGDTSPFVINQFGNVGIGLTSPDALLNIKDTARNPIGDLRFPSNYHLFIQGDNATDKSAGIAFGNDDNNVGAAIIYEDTGTNAVGDLSFWTKSGTGNGQPPARAVTIRSSGQVGIGTRFPSSLLELFGSTPNLRIVNTDATEAGLILDSSAGFEWSILLNAGGNGQLNFHDSSVDIQARFRRDNSAQNDDGWVTATIDYGEFMEKLDHNEEIEIYEVVAVKDNKITKNTEGSSLIMVTSTDAGLRGGNPLVEGYSRDNDPNWLVVAYVGQMPVLVEGKVTEGDYIIPSGKNDGRASAISPDAITRKQFNQVIGRALESSESPVYNTLDTYQDPDDEEQDSEILVEMRRMQQRRGSANIINVAVGVHNGLPNFEEDRVAVDELRKQISEVRELVTVKDATKEREKIIQTQKLEMERQQAAIAATKTELNQTKDELNELKARMAQLESLLYLNKLVAGDFQSTRKMVFLK